MQGNWNLIINVFLLIGVLYGIFRLVKGKRQSGVSEGVKPSLGGQYEVNQDDIISVRRIPSEPLVEPPKSEKTEEKEQKDDNLAQASCDEPLDDLQSDTLMMFIVAKEGRTLAGYELLQTLLSAGLRFGEGHLFHRHQHSNGQGPVLCSLAAATATGVFDLQNIGAFSVRGLCLYMYASGNRTVDAERLNIMLETAKELSEGLDAYLLDEEKNPLTETSLQDYYQRLRLEDNKECESA